MAFNRVALLQEELANEQAALNSNTFDPVNQAERPKTEDEKRVHSNNIRDITDRIAAYSGKGTPDAPIEDSSWMSSFKDVEQPQEDYLKYFKDVSPASTAVAAAKPPTPPSIDIPGFVDVEPAAEEPYVGPQGEKGLASKVGHGIVNTLTDVAETVSMGAWGAVGLAGNLIGNPTLGDPGMAAVERVADKAREFVLDKEEQKRMGFGSKVVSGVAGATPYMLTGMYAIPVMSAVSGFQQGKQLLKEGADLWQAEAGAGLAAAGAYALRYAPNFGKTVAGTVGIGGGINMAQQYLTDATIYDVILRPDQEQIRQNYNPYTLEGLERIGVAGAVGGTMGGFLHATKNTADAAVDKVTEVLTSKAVGKFAELLEATMPTEIKYTVPEGKELKTHLHERLEAGDATHQEIWDLVRQDPSTPTHVRAVLGALTSLSRAIGLDSSIMRYWNADDIKRMPAGFDPDKAKTGEYYSTDDTTKISRNMWARADDPYYQIVHEGVHNWTTSALGWYEYRKAGHDTSQMTPDQEKIFHRVAAFETAYGKIGQLLLDRIAQGKTDFGDKVNKIVWTDDQGVVHQGLSKLADVAQFREWVKRMRDPVYRGTQQIVEPETMRRIIKELYGLTDMHEFASEVISNKDFARLLDSQRYSKDIDQIGLPTKSGKMATLWTQAKEAYKSMLMALSGRDSMGDSLFDAALDHTLTLMEDIALPGDPNLRTMGMNAQGKREPGTHTTSEWDAVNKRLAKLAGDMADRFLKIQKGKGIDATSAHLIGRLDFIRANSNTLDEFMSRAAAEAPNDQFKELLRTWGERLYVEPQHLAKLADAAKISLDDAGLQRYAKTDPDLAKFLRKTFPNLVNAHGDIVATLQPSDDLNPRGTWLANPETLRHLKEGKGAEIMRWVFDRTVEYRTLKAVLYQTAMKHFEPYHKASVADQMKILDVIEGYQGISQRLRLKNEGHLWIPDNELKMNGLTDAQIEIYKAMARGTDYLYSLTDQARIKMGEPPMERIPAYMPHVWQGAFKVYKQVIKKGEPAETAKTVELRTFRTKWAAKKYAEELLAGKHDEPGSKYYFRPAADKWTGHFFSVAKYRDASSTMGITMQEHMRAFQNLLLTDPNTLATIEKMDREQMVGVNKHILERDGVKGWIGEGGSKFGKSWKNRIPIKPMLTREQKQMRLLYQNYAKSVTKFYANTLFMDEVIAPLLDTQRPPTTNRNYYGALLENTPNLRKYIEEYSLNFTGENLNRLDFIDNFLQDVHVAVGVDPLLYRKFTRSVKGWMANLKLKGNPVNLIANAYQPSMAISMLYMFNTMNRHIKGLPSPLASFKKGFDAYFHPTDEHLMYIQWLKDTHQSDPKFSVELSNTGAKLEGQTNMRNFLNWNEGIEGFGRKLSALIAYEHMKQVFKDPIRAREAAVNVMEQSMVNYDRSSRPLMYQNLGLVGEAMSPFAVFRNAAVGNMVLAFKVMKLTEPATWKPFIAMQMTYMMLAGIAGVIGMGEWDFLVMAQRWAFPEISWFPTSREMMAKWASYNLGGDTWAYGILSALSGINMSTTMSAVALDDLANLPLVDFFQGLMALTKIGVRTVGHAIAPESVDPVTRKQIMTASSKVSPPVVKPLVEFIVTQNPFQKTLATEPQAVTEQSMDEFVISILSGKNAVSTQTRVNAVNIDKQRQKQKLEASKGLIDKVVDRLNGGEGVPYETAYTRWYELTGGTPLEFQQAIKAAYEGNYMTYMDKLLNSKKPNMPKRYGEMVEMGATRK